ncbi:MAG: transglutaminase-like domain-containing protein [Chitinophagales bacterium]|nr:transglutaminase-like domain-containing protein [Chitinophagales bacterium]MDW8428394.1 transglutaminase family protein [Chitinophagales bacterium]
MSQRNATELNALLQLLDDPDEEVYRQVEQRLISYGPAIIPALEKAWENATADYSARRIESVIHILHRNRIGQELQRWYAAGSDDLLEAALILSRYRFMNQNERRLRSILLELADQIGMEFSYQMPPLEQISIFNHVLYDIFSFRSVPLDAEHERFTYLKEALESRRATPVLMGIIYLILARTLQLPLHGVLLPQHLVISYHKGLISPTDPPVRLRTSILFYLNPAYRGTVFQKEALEAILRKVNVKPLPKHFMPATTGQIVVALMDQMILGAQLVHDEDRVEDLSSLRAALVADQE